MTNLRKHEELNMRRRWKRLIWMAPLAIAGIALFTWIGGELVMHLWNWLLPTMFGFRQVTFWQALGILALCRILFGGFGFSGGGPPPQIWAGKARGGGAPRPAGGGRVRPGAGGRCG